MFIYFRLITGDVDGNFKQFFTRIENINKKSGPFDLLLVAGEFFSETNNDELEAYKNGFKQVPCPTYILGPTNPNSQKYFDSLTLDNGEICSNLIYLGKRGLYKTTSGLKIAYLSGIEVADGDVKPWNFNRDDVVALRDACVASKIGGEFRGVDILVTSQSPEQSGGLETKVVPSKLISWLALQIKPRYHICGLSDLYYERAPYRVPKDDTTMLDLATRLIIMAGVTNTKKAKYIYAANLLPVEKMKMMDLLQKTTDETECPYLSIKFDVEKGRPANQSHNGNQYFYDMHSQGDQDMRKRRHKDDEFQNKRPRQINQEKCWFCLSSPDVEKHLVITVGDNFYLALPKGPVSENHIMILCIIHIQSSAQLSNESWDELKKFKGAIRKFYDSLGMVCTFIERNYRTSHLLIDCIPVRKELEWQIKLAVEDRAEEKNLHFETLPALEDPSDLPDKSPYFVVELPNGTAMLTRQMKNFPIQLAREIMCAENVLDLENKIDWRECKLSREEEVETVKTLRAKYKPFDFTV